MTIYYLQDGLGNMIEATAEFTLDKENFESWLDESGQTTISNKDWEVVAEEIDGRLDNFLAELLPLVAKQFLAGELEGTFEGAQIGD